MRRLAYLISDPLLPVIRTLLLVLQAYWLTDVDEI